VRPAAIASSFAAAIHRFVPVMIVVADCVEKSFLEIQNAIHVNHKLLVNLSPKPFDSPLLHIDNTIQ
jgi:hypothetical protein